MASSSALKSQPLHNFQLHGPKWAMNHTNNQRLRKLTDSAQRSPHRCETDSDSDVIRKKNTVRDAPPCNGASSGSSLDHKIGKSGKKVINGSGVSFTSGKEIIDDSGVSVIPMEGRSKIYIRLRTKSQKSVVEVPETGNQSLSVEEVEEFVPKTWNLRPRKAITKPQNQNLGGHKIVASAHENKAQRPESSRARNASEPKAAEKKAKKQKFSISLTREEVDDDIFAMTGSKAFREPKKRPKNVQKQLDCLFPGMWLDLVRPDCYKVPDLPLKG
ncbi:putative Mitochondrial transcription termination factor family protein [Hibiscus syriacus]|uniref:Mitochondrial transcription termination factor family protein n=1 Tax=Hibiscus syriacus TaxID=106335 RepID=A0A6A3BYY2_HIBSY|nr:putative Mitochondrial transcription termination factor family protein [Hibiscus syriacus]